MKIRQAEKSDAVVLARLIDLAGEGIPGYLWAGMAEPGETALEAGTRRAARDEGGFSYRNARVLTGDRGVLGMLVAYRLPDPYPLNDLDDCPAIVQPLIRLEAQAPGSWYINAVATCSDCRGKGFATALIRDTEQHARSLGCKRVSLIVASGNDTAIRLYRRLGFKTTAQLPAASAPDFVVVGDWLLMQKSLDAAPSS